MAFNADEYIGVINQIGQNFQELHKIVEACEAFNKVGLLENRKVE